MLLIVYRDNTGEIVRVQPAPPGWLPERMAEEVERFNTCGEIKAHIHELVEGSLEHYLYTLAHQRYGCARESIETALEAIDEARSRIYDLDVISGPEERSEGEA